MATNSKPSVDAKTVEAYTLAARGFGSNCAAALPEKTTDLPAPKGREEWTKENNPPAWEGFHHC